MIRSEELKCMQTLNPSRVELYLSVAIAALDEDGRVSDCLALDLED